MASQITVILVGDSNAGKTSICRSYHKDDFCDSYVATIGTDVKYVNTTVGDQQFKVELWDVAGNPEYTPKVTSFYKKADIVFYVFDSSKQESFKSIARWYEKVSMLTHENVLNVVISNKNDLQRRVSTYEAKDSFAEVENMSYYEVSAKTGEGLQEALHNSIKMILDPSFDRVPHVSFPQLLIPLESDDKEESNTTISDKLEDLNSRMDRLEKILSRLEAKLC